MADEIAPWLVDDDNPDNGGTDEGGAGAGAGEGEGEGGAGDGGTDEGGEGNPPKGDDKSKEGESKEGGEGGEGGDGKPRKGPPAVIPYTRFTQVNTRMHEAEQRAAQLQAELEKYKPKEEPAIDPDAIDPTKYKSLEEYRKAVADAVRSQERQTIAKEKEQESVKAHHQRLAANFDNQVQELAKEIPEVIESVTMLGRMAPSIHPEVRMALLTDEHAARIAHDLMTDEKFAEKVLEAATTADAIRALYRRSLRYDKDESTSSSSGGQQQQQQQQQQQRPEPPRQPRVAPKGDPYANKSGKDLARMYAAGKITKAPWED